MKLLLISYDFLPGSRGGIEYYYHHLCAQLGDRAHVLAPARGDWAAFDRAQGYVIHRRALPVESFTFRRKAQIGWVRLIGLAGLAMLQAISYAWHSCRIVRREGIDLLLIGQLHLAPVGWLVRALTGRPFALSLHGSALSRYWRIRAIRRAAIALLNQAAFLIVNSEFTRSQYLADGVRRSQTFVRVHPGVDVTRFRPDRDAGDIIHRHGLAGRPVILTVARLVEWKGQDMVIRALPAVLKTTPDAVYVIVGEGPHRAALQTLAEELDLTGHVIFAGFVSDEELPLYYAAADVVALVSREIHPGVPIEGFGMVYLEANATGKPVVGARLGGAPEAVADGITGLLVNPCNVDEIAAALSRLLTDPTSARRMGAEGRARAVREFTWEAQAAGLEQHLAAMFPSAATGAQRENTAH